MGDYCIIHAPGWTNFKANLVMLYTVYGYVMAAAGIINGIGKVVGLSKVFNIIRDGEPRTIKLADLKEKAENLIGVLNLFAQMEDPRQEIENIGGDVIALHEGVLSIVEQLTTSYKRVEASEQAKKEAGRGYRDTVP